MSEIRGENHQVASTNCKPPRIAIVWVPIIGRQFNLLVAVLVKVNLVPLSCCLEIQDSAHKRIGMGVLVVELTGLRVVEPRLRDPQADIVFRGIDGLEVFRNRGLRKLPQLCHCVIAQHIAVIAGSVTHILVSLL